MRDFQTAQALGASAVLIGTAWTDQSRQGARGFEARSGRAVHEALGRVLAEADAVKVGMVANPEIVAAILAALGAFAGPVVFDPVLGASAGGALFAGEPAQVMPLVRRAWVTTPNLTEAALLAGFDPADCDSLDRARQGAAALRAAGARAVLVKGGHLSGAATDLLVTDAGEQLFAAARLPGPSPRGTGCALATALAVELARGRDLAAAVATAKSWLHDRIREARVVGGERHL